MGVTPDSIPNSEVKPHSGDGTAWVTVWESSSAQLFYLLKLIIIFIKNTILSKRNYEKYCDDAKILRRGFIILLKIH